MPENDEGETTPKQLIMNPLLTFTISVLFNGAAKNVIELISTHYGIDEIKEAKTLLCNTVHKQYDKHRSTIARSEKYAHTEDIVHILQELDKDELPCFVIDSMGLTKLPKINAESFGYIAMAEKIAEIEQKIELVMKNTHDNSSRCKINTERINVMLSNNHEYNKLDVSHSNNEMQECVPTQSTAPPLQEMHGEASMDLKKTSTVDTQVDGPVQSVTQMCGAVQPSAPPMAEMQGDSTVQPSAPPMTEMQGGDALKPSAPPMTELQGGDDVQSSVYLQMKTQGGGAVQPSVGPQMETQGGGAVQLLVNPHVEPTGTGTAQPTAPLQGNSNGGTTDAQLLNQQQTQNNNKKYSDCISEESMMHSNNNKWHLQKSRHGRRFSRNKPIFGTGTADNCIIMSAPEPRRDIFITRVHCDVSKDKMYNYLISKNLTVLHLDCVSHPDAFSKSFKLSVPKSQYSLVFDPSLWPGDITVKKYISKKNISIDS